MASEEAARQIKWCLDYIRKRYGPGATPPTWPGQPYGELPAPDDEPPQAGM